MLGSSLRIQILGIEDRAYPDPMYPALVPGLNPDEQMNRGARIYAVHVHQFGGHIAGLLSNYLIPLTYNVPTTRPSNETEAGGENQAQAGPDHQQQQPAHQRQVVVRRFEIAFQLDIFLILKLAAVIFLFNQDGSKQRLADLLLISVWCWKLDIYQTGTLVRWLTQGMHRGAVPPPRPHPPAARADNDPAAAMPLDEDAVPEQGTRIVIYNLWEGDEGKLRHLLVQIIIDEKNIQMVKDYPNLSTLST